MCAFELNAEDSTLVTKFRALQSRADVADLLEIKEQFLKLVLYGRKERQNYRVFQIPKGNGGVRVISAPPANLSILQKKLLRVLGLVYQPRTGVTGFVRGRSTLTNAKYHAARATVLNFDLENFFPTIHLGRVRGMLTSKPYEIGKPAAETIAQIACDHAGRLPQGSPTSPILANMVCTALDTELVMFARKHRCSYSRYADDITLSTTRRTVVAEIAEQGESERWVVGNELRQLVERHGFRINPEKTRLRRSRERQRVTGLVVNEFPNVPRNYVRNLRALLHDCRKRGFLEAATKHFGGSVPSHPEVAIKNVVRGKLAYMQMVRGRHDPLFRRLQRMANSIDASAFRSPVPLSSLQSQPLRSRSSRRGVNWQTWIDRYRQSVFLAKCVCAFDGSDYSGTAFQVSSRHLMTAGHNCEIQVGHARCPLDVSLLNPLAEELPVKASWYAYDGGSGLDVGVLEVNFPEGEGELPIPFQERVPEIGEEVIALGFPSVPQRDPDLVCHVGRVEMVASHYQGTRYIGVSFASGGGLSGAPLLDAGGYCIGVMVANTFADDAVRRAYGQAILFEHWRDVPGFAGFHS